MKIHIYSLYSSLYKPTEIRYEVCEAEEKPKTYVLEKYPNHFSKKVLSKDEIGKVQGTYERCVILLERNDELAKSLILKEYQDMLEDRERHVENMKTKINGIKNCEIVEVQHV